MRLNLIFNEQSEVMPVVLNETTQPVNVNLMDFAPNLFINSRTGEVFATWVGTLAQYNAIEEIDPDTMYFIREG